MKSVFWVLFLAALAVALALLLGENSATVTVFWHPWRLDMSLNLVLFALVGGFVLVYLTLRGVAILRGLPLQAQRWRAHQQERAVYVCLLDAVVHQLSGRFVRAQSSAQHAVQLLDRMGPRSLERLPRWRVLAQLLLAESARSLGATDRQQRALQAAVAENGPEAAAAQEGALLRAVAWAIEARDPDKAHHWLSLLPQGAARRIQAVRLRLRLAQLEHDSGSAIDMVRLLTKHKAFSQAAADSLLKGLLKDRLLQSHDRGQLLQIWKAYDARDKADAGLALSWLERWQALPASAVAVEVPDDQADTPLPVLSGDADECRVVEEVLLTVWKAYDQLSDSRRRRLVRWFESQMPALAGEWLQRLEEAQRARPGDAELQYLTGQALMARQLWGKAHQLLAQASRQLADTGLLRRTWCSLALLAEQRGESEAATLAWRQAAQLD
jgi:HemY protein